MDRTGDAHDQQYRTVKEAAAYAGIPERTIRNWIARGKLASLPSHAGKMIRLTDLVPLAAAAQHGTGVAMAATPDNHAVAYAGTHAEREPLLSELRELRQRNESLAQQVGYWQAHYQNVVKLLSVPVPDPVEGQSLLGNRSGCGGDSGARSSCQVFRTIRTKRPRRTEDTEG